MAVRAAILDRMVRQFGFAFVALSALFLAGCGDESAAPGPAPTPPSAPPPAPSTPAPSPFSGASGYAIFQTLAQNHHVTYPYSDACPDGVRYDDSACGRQLTGMKDVAADVIDVLDGRYKDKNSKDIVEAAKTVRTAYSNAANLGCYGLKPAGKKVTADNLPATCALVLPMVGVSYQGLLAAVFTASH